MVRFVIVVIHSELELLNVVFCLILIWTPFLQIDC